MSEAAEGAVIVTDSFNGPYGMFVTSGRHVMGADELPAAGGHDTGPSPYDLLKAALGTCTAMTVRMYAARHSWPLEKISVAVTHAKVDAPEGGGKVDRFERVITLTGPLSEDQKDRLVEIAERCPVSRTLRQGSATITRAG